MPVQASRLTWTGGLRGQRSVDHAGGRTAAQLTRRLNTVPALAGRCAFPVSDTFVNSRCSSDLPEELNGFIWWPWVTRLAKRAGLGILLFGHGARHF